jgi:hypothetical protein
MEATTSKCDVFLSYEEDEKGHPLVVTINTACQRRRAVNVLKSIESDPSNMGEPLIILAITECGRAIELRRARRTHCLLDERTGEAWLKKISGPALSGARKRRKEMGKYRFAMKILRVSEAHAYFNDVAAILSEAQAEGVPSHAWIESVIQEINALHQDKDSRARTQEMAQFLTEFFSLPLVQSVIHFIFLNGAAGVLCVTSFFAGSRAARLVRRGIVFMMQEAT